MTSFKGPFMTRRCGLLLVVLPMILGVAAAAGADETRVDASLLRRSVVKIEVEGEAFDIKKGLLVLVPFKGVGSGVAVGDGQFILTAGHVLAQSNSAIRVTGSEGTTVNARPIAVDREMDVAILRLEEPLTGTVAARVRLNPPVVGMDLWVMGHPLGLEYSLTRGIVSALRGFDEFGIYSWNGHIIQLDAALNQGVSGGGLFDDDGQLVGVAGSIVSRSGGFEGIGFAAALDAIQEMIEASPCVFLGVDASPLPRTLAKMLGLPIDGAFMVQQVFPGGLAEKAGLRGGSSPSFFDEGPPVLSGGDIILEINGLAECREACRLMTSRRSTGSDEAHEISLTVWRGGTRLPVVVTSHRAPHPDVLNILGLPSGGRPEVRH